MQNYSSKTQPSKLPYSQFLSTEGRAEELTLQNIISDFYFQASVTDHCASLNELYLAFTGCQRNIDPSKTDISNMVFEANELKKFMLNLKNLFNEEGVGQSVAGIVGNVLIDINIMNYINVLDDAVLSFISAENWTPWNPDYLKTALGCFDSISELLKVFGMVDLIANQMKGGVSC